MVTLRGEFGFCGSHYFYLLDLFLSIYNNLLRILRLSFYINSSLMATAVDLQRLDSLKTFIEPDGERLDATLVSLLRSKEIDKAVSSILVAP